VGRFSLEEFAETTITPRFDVAPSQEIPIVVERPGGRELRTAKWGFVPFFMKDGKGKRPPPINARAETLATNGMFPAHWASGDASFRRTASTSGRRWTPTRSRSNPCMRSLGTRASSAYAQLRDKGSFGSPTEENPGGTAAIITTAPNELMAPIHNRMPAIFLPAREDVWLDPKMTDPAEALTLLTPYPADAMMVTPVSTKVNVAVAEGPELILPINSA
jgi:putative SOS response-associated peptidase YedK